MWTIKHEVTLPMTGLKQNLQYYRKPDLKKDGARSGNVKEIIICLLSFKSLQMYN